jgi:hypothetical protein
MKFWKAIVVVLALSIPALVMAQAPSTAPAKAPEAKAATTPAPTAVKPAAEAAKPATTPTPTAATTAKPAEAATKVAATPTTTPETLEGTIEKIDATGKTFTLKDNSGNFHTVAYTMNPTFKAGEKVKVKATKSGLNWNATNVETVK